jgi:RNA polymerase sigma-70 factor (ECF subfamily)
MSSSDAWSCGGSVTVLNVARTATKRQTSALRLIPGGSAAQNRIASDEEIIDAFEQGDPRFGSLLYQLLVDVVDGTLFRMLGRYEPEHDDLAQIAFEQIVATLASRRFARACSLRSWAAAVTSHVALNCIRKRGVERKVFDRRQEGDVLAAELPGPINPERDASARAELDQIRAALGRMSPKLAETVVLHDALGYGVPEVAVLTGISVSAAQSRLARGRQALTRQLASEPEEVGQ